MIAKHLGAPACLAILLTCLLAPSPALALPELGLQLERTTTPLTHSDERTVYEITVQNTGSANPAVGDPLTCNGVPPAKSWFFATEFEIEWLRNGVSISKGPAATNDTYTLLAADEGKAIQCVVTGTNPSARVALAEGVAEASTGSNVLRVRSKLGTGTLTAGSKVVTSATTFQGPFGPEFLVGLEITGTGIPAGTTITAVNTGAQTLELSNAATASGTDVVIEAGAAPFAVGQLIFGPNGIQQGAEITAVSGQRVTISAPATGSFDSEQVYATADPPESTASSSSFASLPLVVAPVPSPAPPTPIAGPGRPGISPSLAGEDKRTCNAAAMNLSGSPSFAYEWLRDGEPIPGATSSEYTPGPEDVGHTLQCKVTASNVGGAIAGISTMVPVRVANAPSTTSTPTIEFSNDLTGEVTVEMELPGGQETYALRAVGSGWKCAKEQPSESENASARCKRSDTLGPGGSYPAIELVERPGADAPDTLVTKVTASGGGALVPVSKEDSFSVLPADTFGFEAFEIETLGEDGSDYRIAGGHPFSAGAHVAFKEHVAASPTSGAGFRALNGHPREVRTEIPRGFVGNPEAVPENCPQVADMVQRPSTCPEASAVGQIDVVTSVGTFADVPIYAIEPEFGTPAEFGFGLAAAGEYTYALVAELDPQNNYAVRLVTSPVAKNPKIYEATVTLCGFGARLSVDSSITKFDGCKKAGDPDANPKPLLTNPTRCDALGPLTRISADTWETPGQFVSEEFFSPTLEQASCEAVPFEPSISFAPTSNQADSPTGMDVELTMPTEGLETPEGIAQANLANATVTLPVGMAVNPSLASGLGACSAGQVGLGNNNPATCPDSSKVGTVEVQTPLLEQPLQGSVYVAKQSENPFNSLFALYMVLESERFGLTLKVAGLLSPDPLTGQLTTTFKQNPEAPFSRLSLHLPAGPGAPLINPPACGTYEIHSSLTPWTAADPLNPTAEETVSSASAFTVGAGPNGGPCPSGALEPKLKAGGTEGQAGATSPFVFDLSREDGTQRFAGLEMTTPPGLSGYLKGIPRCSEAALASISGAAGTGQAQIASPACPAQSQVGTVLVGAGAGPNPFYTDSGRAYLAPPYKGAPLSIAVVAPAVAGPFDLGSVVVRNALHVNPTTAQITVKSDPIPTILHGLLLDIRSTRVMIDRPNFILNPTNCEPLSIAATVKGENGGTANLSERFQVGGCEKLGFKPNLKLRLKGGTKRGDYQRLTATLNARPGDANIARASVTLPHSMFLAQEHIRTICTRVQFAAKACPKGSVVGSATAITPLIEEPLTGTAYLRSSNNPLPDLVIALKGPDSLPIEVELAGRIDSKNKGIRNTFDLVPDAPVTSFRLELLGGKKSLIVNSRDLCKGKQRASVKMTAQNGLLRDFRPVVGRKCKGKKGASAKRSSLG